MRWREPIDTTLTAIAYAASALGFLYIFGFFDKWDSFETVFQQFLQTFTPYFLAALILQAIFIFGLLGAFWVAEKQEFYFIFLKWIFFLITAASAAPLLLGVGYIFYWFLTSDFGGCDTPRCIGD